MRMAGEINIPAHDRIEMRPGGTHIMLEGLRAPLRTGDDFDLVLKFRNSRDQTVKVTRHEARRPMSQPPLRVILWVLVGDWPRSAGY